MDPSSQNFIELHCQDETTSSIRTFQINPDKIELLVKNICQGLGVDTFELSWNFVDDEEMQELNRQYRDKDRSTDVLSFPQQEWETPLVFRGGADPLRGGPEGELPEYPRGGPGEERPWSTTPNEVIPEMLGDVVISPSVALQNAKNIGHDLDREVCFLLVHGILHLCGHDHMNAEEEELMTQQQQVIMKHLESSPEGPLWIDCARIGN